MKKKNFSKVFAVIALAASSVTSYAQQNLGADCGCPPVNSRPIVDLAGAAYSVVGGGNDGDLTANNTILDCTKRWKLSKKTYVPAGKTLTILPGTVVIGADVNSTSGGTAAGQAAALIVEKDGKIVASGTESCPIVFTADADPMDGTYSISNRGKWGGIAILGKAQNNLTLAANGPFDGAGKLAVADGIGVCEGYLASDGRNQFGVTPANFDNTDNSGVLRYVSIRHAGDIVGSGNELNGLTLASVGSGTTIDHIEIVACDDDNIEFFGGTVNVKYVVGLYGADDMFDYDLGYSGKAQFVFGLQADSTISPTADNGIEADADDQRSNLTPRSHPKLYNFTMIGNGRYLNTGDNTGHCGIQDKELTEGEVYNSVIAKFNHGLNFFTKTGANNSRSINFEAYNNWAAGFSPYSGTLIASCNTFVGNNDNLRLDAQRTASGTAAGSALYYSKAKGIAPSATDLAKFTADGNLTPASIAGFDYSFGITASTNVVTDKYNAVPNLLTDVATSCTPPNDGFFTAAGYRGAFEPGKKNWMAGWTSLSLYGNTNSAYSASTGFISCPTDIDQNGVTNNADFLELIAKFNQSCQ